jgi:MYXO-CTERM domain-containing protein
MRYISLTALSSVAIAAPVLATTYTSDLTIAYNTNAVWGAADSISGHTVTVSGTLNVQGGSFAPDTLNLTYNAPGATPVTPVVTFAGGTIQPGSISVDEQSELYVNAAATTGTVTNGNIVDVGANLTLTGAFANNGAVTVRSGATLTATTFTSDIRLGTLRGSGRIAAASELGGAITPGNEDGNSSVGTLSFTGNTRIVPDAEIVDGGTVLFLDLIHDDLAGTWSFDKLDVTGAATVGGHILLNISDVEDLQVGDRFPFLAATSVLGLFDGIVNPEVSVYDELNDVIIPMGTFQLEYDRTGPEQGATLVLVPEPGTMGLLALAALPLIRRRRAAAPR